MAVGSEQDFDAFYTATYRRVVGQIFAISGSMSEAEDAVQESYARAWQRWSKLSMYEDPEAWVRKVAYRLAVSSWRRSVNRISAHRRERSAAEVPGMSPDHLDLVAALRKISAEQRLAIVLYHFAGLSVDEIAAHTGSRASAVKARLARGRKALAPHLGDFGDSAADSRVANVPTHQATSGKAN